MFLIFPPKKGLNQKTVPWYDALLAIMSFGVGMYIIQNQTSSSIISGRPTDFDLAIGLALIILVLEATRRVVGKPLVIIALIFIGYFFLGEYMPGQFFHDRGDFERFVYEISYRNNGIFGTPIYASAQFVFIFILFGAILESTGAGQMFINLAIRAFGRFKGGPAKASVLASGRWEVFQNVDCECGDDWYIYHPTYEKSRIQATCIRWDRGCSFIQWTVFTTDYGCGSLHYG